MLTTEAAPPSASQALAKSRGVKYRNRLIVLYDLQGSAARNQ